MRYARLGDSGLMVSRLALGALTFGANFTLPPAAHPARYRLVRQRADDHAVAEVVQLVRSARYPILPLGPGGFVSPLPQASLPSFMSKWIGPATARSRGFPDPWSSSSGTEKKATSSVFRD